MLYTVSEIVLTRGWDGTRSAAKMAKSANARYNKPAGDMPEFSYKSLTRFAAPVEKEIKNVTVTTGKMVEQNLEKFGKILKNRQNKNN